MALQGTLVNQNVGLKEERGPSGRQNILKGNFFGKKRK